MNENSIKKVAFGNTLERFFEAKQFLPIDTFNLMVSNTRYYTFEGNANTNFNARNLIREVIHEKKY
jgi:hypothetical protein